MNSGKKTAKRVGTFVWVGLLLTVIDYLFYELLIILFFKDTSGASIASSIAGVLSSIVAYFLHSRITWKEVKITKSNTIKFFIWNALMFVLLRPGIIWIFGLCGGLYRLVFSLLSWTGLNYDFVASTGTYVLTAVITMTLNFLFYNSFVFGQKAADKKKINEESIK